jgi:hypothetical protein
MVPSAAVGVVGTGGGGKYGDTGEAAGGRLNVEMIDTGYLEDMV